MASGWIVRIGEQDYPISDVTQLQTWAAERRIEPSHYVFHPMFDRWMYAKDLEELKGAFPPSAPPVAPPPLTTLTRAVPVPKGSLYCLSCGAVGSARVFTKGSFFIEIILWLAFFIPGLIYTIWRLTTRERVCRQCRQNTLIPADSPRAQQLLSQRSSAA